MVFLCFIIFSFVHLREILLADLSDGKTPYIRMTGMIIVHVPRFGQLIIESKISLLVHVDFCFKGISWSRKSITVFTYNIFFVVRRKSFVATPLYPRINCSVKNRKPITKQKNVTAFVGI